MVGGVWSGRGERAVFERGRAWWEGDRLTYFAFSFLKVWEMLDAPLNGMVCRCVCFMVCCDDGCLGFFNDHLRLMTICAALDGDGLGEGVGLGAG